MEKDYNIINHRNTLLLYFIRVRFKEYDGGMLEEFVYMRREVPEAFYNALLKDNIPMADILKINRAIKQLYK